MNFKYCRAYSWPNRSDNWSRSEIYFEKMVTNAKELETRLPCSFAIIWAYESKDSPFALVALDLDYHSVASSEISQVLDDFEGRLGKPIPESLENPGWWTASVDVNYKSTLASCGITLLEGEFYQGAEMTQRGRVMGFWKKVFRKDVSGASQSDNGNGDLVFDTENPRCSTCGATLSSTDIFGGATVAVSGTRSVEDVKDDLTLFRGSVCFPCKAIICMECNCGDPQTCPKCQQDTKPAYRKHLRTLSQL